MLQKQFIVMYSCATMLHSYTAASFGVHMQYLYANQTCLTRQDLGYTLLPHVRECVLIVIMIEKTVSYAGMRRQQTSKLLQACLLRMVKTTCMSGTKQALWPLYLTSCTGTRMSGVKSCSTPDALECMSFHGRICWFLCCWTSLQSFVHGIVML